VAIVINGVATRLDKGRALAVLAQLKPGGYVFQYPGFRSKHVDLLMYYQNYLVSISGRP
jgi:hypothetical protein